MPSSIGHAAMAILLRPMLPVEERNAATIGFAAAAAVAVDIDAIGWWFGGGDASFLGGHRGFTHSIAAAMLIAAAGAHVLVRRRRASSIKAVFPYLAAVIMSHGVLDMFTTYGDGIALFAPFTMARFASPLQPLTGVVLTEILILWVPTALILAFRGRARIPVVAAVALGLAVGLADLRSMNQPGAYLSILLERMTTAGRFDAESTRRMIAAAEASGSSTSAHRCVAVSDTDAMATSGNVIAFGWPAYRTAWTQGHASLWWRTVQPSVGPSDTATLSVRAIRLDRPLPPGAERGIRQAARVGDTLVYTLKERRPVRAFRSSVRVPTPGQWLFIATMEDNWGCFIFRV